MTISKEQSFQLAANIVSMVKSENRTKMNVTQSLIYLLVSGHENGSLPAHADMTKAWAVTDGKAAKLRNDLILNHTFKVMEQVTDGKSNVVSYKAKEGIEPAVISMLKTRINRALVPVAWLLKHGGTTTTSLNKDHSLTVIGRAYYSADDLKNAPEQADNKVALTGKKNQGTLDELIRAANKGLGIGKAKTRDTGEELRKYKLADLTSTVNGKLAALSDEAAAKMSKTEQDELRALFDTIADIFERGSKSAAATAETKLNAASVARKAAEAKEAADKYRAAQANRPLPTTSETPVTDKAESAKHRKHNKTGRSKAA